jgi:oligoendopeptidase F
MSDLPRWDLADLYLSVDCAELSDDKQLLLEKSAKFNSDYRGLVCEKLLQAVRDYEEIMELTAKLSSYSDLLFATNSTDVLVAKFYQDMGDLVNEAASELAFFTVEINAISENDFDELLKNDAQLNHYLPWLRDVRSFIPHQLSEELEKLMVEKQGVANSSWLRLYEDICNRMKITVAEQELTLPEALDLLSDADANMRQNAAMALSEIFNDKIETFALILNNVIKDKQINDNWRGFARAVSSRNLANLVEDEIVDSLAITVQRNYTMLSEKYYRWKAKQFDKEKLNFWDRNAPLPYDADEYIEWDKAKEIVLAAYRNFSPTMAKIAESFFTNNWIDAPVMAGKTSGAFSHPCAASVHPYILLNHQGKMRDVMTLAHELGHGVHQILAQKQGALMADTPLTLTETASVFGEELTFQYLLKSQKGLQRKALIAGKVEDMLNTVVRQIAFYQFETLLHDARKQGELTPAQISEIWLQTQKQSFGEAIIITEQYQPFWAYISHFFHSPFYVYAYAFGNCLVNSLYAIYQQEDKAAFEQKYLQMLAAGGTLRHKELLAPFGIDIAQADFWQKGLDYIAQLIDELEQ